MKNQLQPNDIPLLAKIFNPDTEIVYVFTTIENLAFYQKIQDNLDCILNYFTEAIALQKEIAQQQSNQIVVLNLRPENSLDAYLQRQSNLIIIDFSRTKISSPSNTFQFDFINNRDTSIRWIYPTKNNQPIFLNLYNATGWKGQLFQTVFKIGFKLKLKKWFKSGTFRVIANGLFLEKINQRLTAAQYAIFTGTVGVNRKAVISFEEAGKATQFLIMPLTKVVQKLVDKEAFYLKKLQTYSFKQLVIPQAKKIGNNLLVSNVCPNKVLNNSNFTKVHLSALHELYEQTTQPTFLKSTKVWQFIHQDLDTIATAKIVNDLSKEKVKNCYKQLSILAENFEAIEMMPMAITHGDLTPWNSYLSDKQLHVYDWELADRLPLLYDAFHYIFQTSILVKRIPFSEIKLQLEALEKAELVQSILTKFKVNFQQAYQFYLLRNTSYYLSKYMEQGQLHAQAHWLIGAWAEALTEEGMLVREQLRNATKTG